MWYDKYPGIPDRGSPLETLFMLVHVQRQETELMATRAQVMGVLGSRDPEGAKSAIEAFKSYCDTMFPFLEQATSLDKTRHMERLMSHVKAPISINVGAMRREKVEAAVSRAKSLQRYKIGAPKIPGVK